MITPQEEEFIKNHAYVPEHLAGYGMSISQGEPFFLEDYLCYQRREVLIFVGYPLSGRFDEKRMEEILQRSIQRFNPAQVALQSAVIPAGLGRPSQPDSYYKLDLANRRTFSKVKNMVRRAGKELKVEKGREFQDEHRELIEDFLACHPVDEGTRTLFQKIPAYLSSVPSACLLEARNSRGELAAFDIAEFGARDYAFYMFNFRSQRAPVPGASDLLLQALISEAEKLGKSSVNLGLGVNAKVAFFKEKWGGVPFLPYQFLHYRPSPPSLFGSFLQGFLKKC